MVNMTKKLWTCGLITYCIARGYNVITIEFSLLPVEALGYPSVWPQTIARAMKSPNYDCEYCTCLGPTVLSPLCFSHCAETSSLEYCIMQNVASQKCPFFYDGVGRSWVAETFLDLLAGMLSQELLHINIGITEQKCVFTLSILRLQ